MASPCMEPALCQLYRRSFSFSIGRGYFQPERGRSACYLCPGGVRIRHPGSTHATACQGHDTDDQVTFLGWVTVFGRVYHLGL